MVHASKSSDKMGNFTPLKDSTALHHCRNHHSSRAHTLRVQGD